MELLILEVVNPMTIDYTIPAWGVVLFGISVGGAIVKIYIDHILLKKRVTDLETEKKINDVYKVEASKEITKVNTSLTQIKVMLRYALKVNPEEEEEEDERKSA